MSADSPFRLFARFPHAALASESYVAALNLVRANLMSRKDLAGRLMAQNTAGIPAAEAWAAIQRGLDAALRPRKERRHA
jgi:hypothetical protein